MTTTSKNRRTASAYTAPDRLLLWSEGGRATMDSFGYWAALPLLATGPRGDGHEVLVLPGLGADDRSTIALRGLLRARGYSAQAWGLGPNLGPTRTIVDGLLDALDDLYERQDRPVSLVGWSLGGILSRVIAKHNPDKVRGVVTLGSPFRLTVETSPLASHAGPLFEALRPWHTGFLDFSGPTDERIEVNAPSTSIYSKFDGVVPWQACLDIEGPQRENVEVTASHMGMGVNPRVLSIILDRLSQPEGEWQPYGGGGA